MFRIAMMTTGAVASAGAVSRTRWARLIAAGAAVALVIVDITVVNVALPRILDSLRLAVVDGEWINTAYSLTFAALLIVMGRLGDQIGRRLMLVGGLMLFAAGSLAAGSAGGLGTLLAGRVVQGLGAAAILPATLAVVHASFTGKARAIAFGVWGSLIAGMAAVGPLVGGWLAAEHGWRWVFYINIPVALVLAGAVGHFIEGSTRRNVRSLDVHGALTSALGMVLLVFGLTEGPRYGWLVLNRAIDVPGLHAGVGSPSFAIPSLVAGLAVLGLFVVVEERRVGRGDPVLFDLTLFRHRSFRVGNLLALLIGLGEFGVVFVLPIWLQAGLELSTFDTGKLLLWMALGGFLGGPIAGALTHLVGAKRLVTLGLGLEAMGGGLLVAAMRPNSLTIGIAIALAIYGLGVGVASAQLASVIMSDIPEDRAGQAAGMQSTVRQAGAAFGVAILGSTFVTVLGTAADRGLGQIEGLGVDQHANIVHRISQSAGWYVEALRAWTPDFAPVVAAVESAIMQAARWSVLAAMAFFVIGLLAARRLPAKGHRQRAVPVAEDQNILAEGSAA